MKKSQIAEKIQDREFNTLKSTTTALQVNTANLKTSYEKNHIDITSLLLAAPCFMNGTDETVRFNAILATFKRVFIPSGTLVANVLYKISDMAIGSVDTGISIKGAGSKSSIIKPPLDNTTVLDFKGKSEATITLASVVAGDTVTVGGLIFTAHANTTTKANREFAINGDDTADVTELISCILDPTDGVPNVAAVNASTKLTLVSVAAGDSLIINGLTFTAHANTTTKANREFAISGTDTADAYQLVLCINDPTYGVPGVTASNSGGTIKLLSATPSNIVITNLPATITTSSVINLVSTNESNLKITITSSNSTRINCDFYRYSIYNLQIENVHITGAANNTNNLAMRLDYVQNLTFKDSRMDYCYGGAILMNDTMDCTFKTNDIVYCSKANSDTDYSYAIQMNEVFDCCNALKFDTIKIEHSPCMFYSNGRNRHNYFVNCKFEKSIENKTTLWNPMKFTNAREFSFTNCLFVNTHGTFESTIYSADNGLYFLLTTDASISLEHQRQRIKFINCNFTTNSLARVQWASIVNTSLNHCDFYWTRGTDPTYAPFYFKGYCDVKDTLIAIADNSRCFVIAGKYNDIDVKINFETASPTLASLWMGASADFNNISFTLIKNNRGSILAPDFIANGYMYLKNNRMKDKAKTYVTTSESTVAMECTDIAKVGGNVSLISQISNEQVITLLATASITITHSAFIVLRGGANVNLTAGQIMRLICIDGVCYEQ